MRIAKLVSVALFLCQFIGLSPLAAKTTKLSLTSSTPLCTPTISLSVVSRTICTGSAAVFSTSITNGGSSPTYQWIRNGSVVGGNTPTLTTVFVNNGDVFACVLISNDPCAAAGTATVSSNAITMVVSSSLTPNVVISTPTSTICGGSAVFTSTVTHGGVVPTYQWKKNGTNVGSNIPTYSPTSLVNGDVIFCQLTSTLSCATPSAVNSNSITITASTSVAPTIIISVPSNTMCGSSAAFTSTITNGGSTPAYQWKKNGTNVGSNIPTYSPTTLVNGDVISCQLISNLACASPTAVSSNSITMTISSSVVPTILVSTSSNTICGTSAVFSSTITDGGSAPVYQWKKNGTNVGSNISTYSPTTLVNGDVISCQLTSNLSCASPTAVSSNSVTMTISSSVVPSVLIATPTNTICGGAAVFSSTITNGGSAPSYQWKKNGTNVGSNIPTYSPTTLVNGDMITCQLTSNLSCASPSVMTSNAITMVVSSSVTPTILISTPSNTICGTTSAVFTSMITNGGTTPSYQWKKNGVNVGSNIDTYSPTTLVGGDVIYCQLTSNLGCANPAAVNSNSLMITISTSVTPTILISVPSNTICGSSAVFSSAITNGGSAPAYQWIKNGSNVGTNSATYSVTTLVNGDVVQCYLTSNHACATPSSIMSSPINMVVLTCTGIENIADEKTVLVYPNPANGVLYIEILNGEKYSVKLSDEIGRVLLTEENSKRIETSAYANGIYYLNITKSGVTTIKKVVIAH